MYSDLNQKWVRYEQDFFSFTIPLGGGEKHIHILIFICFEHMVFSSQISYSYSVTSLLYTYFGSFFLSFLSVSVFVLPLTRGSQHSAGLLSALGCTLPVSGISRRRRKNGVSLFPPLLCLICDCAQSELAYFVLLMARWSSWNTEAFQPIVLSNSSFPKASLAH